MDGEASLITGRKTSSLTGCTSFSIRYTRPAPPRHLDPAIERNILKELAIDQRAIQDPQVPRRSYNYSYVQRRLQTTYRQSAALDDHRSGETARLLSAASAPESP